MAIQLIETNGGRVLEVIASDKLTESDYQKFVPEFERLARLHGKMRVLYDMRDFHGWEAKGLWEDIKFDVKHFADFDRVALVGDAQWQSWMATACRPFLTGEVRHFESAQLTEARVWVEAP
ncbi:MAG: STAS/SEC14 domain-containing protein [Chthoniobacteraceae bacterium]